MNVLLNLNPRFRVFNLLIVIASVTKSLLVFFVSLLGKKRANLGNAIPRSVSEKPAMRVWHRGGKSVAFWSVMLVLLGTIGGLARGEVTVKRMSENAAGEPGNDISFNPSISADGLLVAFESRATNLVPGDTNGAGDIFVKNVETGEIVRVSEDAAGMQGNGRSGNSGISISADGLLVAFESRATNLVPGDTNGNPDVFVKNQETGEIVRVSENAAGEQGNEDSENPSLSADGSFVAFESFSSNLVPGDTNRTLDIFVKNVDTGEIVRASEGARGEQGSSDNSGGSISADGRFVAFPSFSNLVPDDTNGTGDVFVKNVETGEIVRVSEDAMGVEGNGESRARPSISADGRVVTFDSAASNLVSGDTNGVTDVFVKNVETGVILRVSEDVGGIQGNARSGDFNKSISADGRFVAFSSNANNLVPGDTNDTYDVFVKNVGTGEIERVSEGPGGAELGLQANDRSSSSSISADGRFVAFVSYASNLVPGDTNDGADVFLADVAGVHAPTTPGNLSFAVYSRTAAEVFWDRSSDNGGILYEVIRNGEPIGVLDALSVFEDDLQPGVGYTYLVTAIDNDGNRSATATVSFTTNDTEPPDNTNPPIPGNLRSLVYSDTAAEVFWDRPVGEAYLYRVYFNGVLEVETDGVSWWSEDFTPGSTTEVMVVAVDSNGAESSPAVVIVQTSGASLSPVTGLRAEIYSATAAEIFWDRIPGVGQQYRVYADGVEVETTDGTSWFSDGFAAGSTTKMTVVVINGPNESAQQSVIVTTRGGNPAEPPSVVPVVTGLRSAVYGEHFAEVFWDRPTDLAYSYRVFLNGVLEVETDAISWWSRDFAPGSITEVTVIAVDSQGAESPLATVIVQTPGGDIDPESISYEIEDTGPAGGIVFSISDDGTSGFEAAPMDQSSASWCSPGGGAIDLMRIPGLVDLKLSTDIDPNSGAANTTAILGASDCRDASAAEAASAYVWPNGQTDGFLPNKEELDLLYNQRAVVGGFVNERYWSSSQFDVGNGWLQSFANGIQNTNSKSGGSFSTFRVRSVRAF